VKKWTCVVVDNSLILPPILPDEKDHISEYVNDGHDDGAVHTAYMERVIKVKEKLETGEFYNPDGAVDWKRLVSTLVHLYSFI
jgi:hypothetical protein